MKKQILFLNIVVLAFFLSFSALAGAPGSVTGLLAQQSNGKVIVSFTELDPDHTKGYLVLRDNGFVSSNSNSIPKLEKKKYEEGNVVSGWQVVSVNETRDRKVVLEQGHYTYLIYTYNTQFEYALPKNILLSNLNVKMMGSWSADMVVAVAGDGIEISNGAKLQISRDGSLALLNGRLFNNGELTLYGKMTVPANTLFDNGDGSLIVKSGGELNIQGNLEMKDEPKNTLQVESGAKLSVAPLGALLVSKHSKLIIQKDSEVRIDGTFTVSSEVHTDFIVSDDANITFGAGSKFDLWQTTRIPKATWLDNSTIAFHGSSVPEGLNQSFYNFIWDSRNQYSNNSLTCDFKNIRGDFTIQSTNNYWLVMNTCGDMAIGGALTLEGTSKIRTPKKLSVSGGIQNSGTLEIADQLTVGGDVTNKTGGVLLLPKTTVANGAFTNESSARALNAGSFEAFTLAKGLVNKAGAALELPKNTLIKGDVTNEGNLVGNENLTLEGSFDNRSGSSYTSATGMSNIKFSNDTHLNRASVLSIPEGLVAAQSVWVITIEKDRAITLGANLELGANTVTDKKGSLKVRSGAELHTRSFTIKSAAGAIGTTFELEDGATLSIGHAGGIAAAPAAAGAVQTAARTFSGKAYYTYNGTAEQVTGDALPAKLEGSIVLDNPTSVKISQNTTVTKLLYLKKGNLNLNGKTLTLNWSFLTDANTTLTGSSTSGLVINNDNALNLSLPGVTLGDLTVKIKDQLTLTGDVVVYKSLIMDKGIINTGSKKVTLMPTATLTEDDEDVEKGFVLGQVETEHNTQETNKLYAFSNIGLDLKFKGRTAGVTKIVRVTGNTSETSKDIVVSRAFRIYTAVDGGLGATMVFHYMKHEIKEMLKEHEDGLKLLKSTDGGQNYRNIAASVANKSAQTVTLENIDKLSASSSSTSGMSANQPATQPDVVGGLLPSLTFSNNPFTANGFKSSAASAAMAATSTMASTSAMGASTWTAGDPTLGVLPVELQNFTGRINGLGGADLSWSTASEQNNSHFEVERSLDGSKWATVGQVQGAGTTATPRSYTFTDSRAAGLGAEQLFYRLKQVDFDGAFTYSAAVALKPGGGGARISQLYYDATAGVLEVSYAGLRPELPLQVVLCDASGRLLLDRVLSLGGESGTVRVAVGRLAGGVVVAKAASGEARLTSRLLVR